MKLKTKLLSAFSAVCIIGSVVSAIGIESMSAISNQADLTYKQDLIGVALTQEANVDLLYVGRSIRNAILASTDEQRAKFLAESDKDLELTRTNLDKAKPLFYSERGKAKFAEVEQSWKDYVDAVAQMRTKASSTSLQDRGALTDYLFGDFAQRVNHVDNLLSDLTDIKEQNAKTAAESNLRRYQLSRDVMIALVLASLGFGIGIGSWITRGVTRQLGAEPDAATGLAQSVASGDLTVPINLRAGDTTSLMASLQTMRDSLATVVADVRQNAENVATASAEIAQGNLDLSSRTEEQASALQQTAASMEELSTTVTQNAENAKQANQLALDANTIAAKGGEVFEDVVSNMKSVNESSQRIADIISVIDGIAFQTNILALNAAVEAARAGDHGRGFAVVASEVRNLAQRSAAAAKEIKTLIQASVDSVQEGSALVDQAGTTMQDVVVAIQRVTDIMGEISAASSEQSIGVAQVGEAVSQMDQVTQQNAALVEESAAAAESLKSQSTLLVQAVAVFKLAGDKHRVAREPSANASSVVRKRIVAAAPPVQKSAKVVSVSSPVREPVVGTAVAAGGDWQTF